jgi:hypothetical protein
MFLAGNVTALSLSHAARVTGLGRITITRAIKAKWHSASRKQDGGYEIDAVAPASSERRARQGPPGLPAHLKLRLSLVQGRDTNPGEFYVIADDKMRPRLPSTTPSTAADGMLVASTSSLPNQHDGGNQYVFDIRAEEGLLPGVFGHLPLALMSWKIGVSCSWRRM